VEDRQQQLRARRGVAQRGAASAARFEGDRVGGRDAGHGSGEGGRRAALLHACTSLGVTWCADASISSRINSVSSCFLCAVTSPGAGDGAGGR